MDLRLTVLDPRRAGAVVDVAVRAAAGTPLSAVRAQVLAAVGAAPEAGLCCAGRRLDGAAPLGVRPLLQGAILTTGPPTAAAGRAGSTAVVEIHVVSGPDAGARFPLPPGTWRVGRGAGAAIRLADPGISRVHAEIGVGAGGVLVRDLGSTNGTTVDGLPVDPGAPRAVPGTARIHLGSSTLAVRAVDAVPAAVLPDGRGHLLVNRAPRPGPAPATGVVTVPEPVPEPVTGPDPPRIAWPHTLLPVLLAVPLAVFWHQPAVVLMGLASPLVSLVQHLAHRRRVRRDAARAAAEHRAGKEQAEREATAAMAAGAAALEHRHPDLAMIAAIAAGPTDRLWERAVGAPLEVRLGLGRVPAPLAGAPARPARSHPSAPLSIDLAAVGVLGVTGPRAVAVGLARAALGQLAVLHSPRDLRLAVICADARHEPEWDWLRWLPHHAAASEVVPGGPEQCPRAVVVLDGAARLRPRPEVGGLLTGGPGRVQAVCLDATPAHLPVECGATVAADDPGTDAAGGPVVLTVRTGGNEARAAAEPAPARWADQLARSLAPLRESSPGDAGRLPEKVRLLDLYPGLDPTDPAELATLWAAGGSRPRARLGVTPDGPFEIDLARDGPHVLIGGTTGAGKSELLKTLVTGLAVAHPPDLLGFLLVDYKGGTAFAGCTGLPHVTGLLTDLDEHLSRRALSSLAGELQRRERLLRTAGAGDVKAYHQGQRRNGGAGSRSVDERPALPRLVIVVDEFRVLAEELPGFVTGLVRIAAVGRSLGVHLVLATQRPAGAVSADIRANVNLRIALRVRDRADSEDVVGVADAAGFDPALPGRAVACTGGGAPVTFQTASVSVPAAQPISVQVLHRGASGSDPPVRTCGAGDLERIVAASRAAAARLGLPPAPAPWLPPLPRDIDLTDLHPPPGARWAVPFAIADRPAARVQDTLAWALDGAGHLAVIGAPRSGRTTVLRTLAVSAGLAVPPGTVHVHAVDGGGGLSDLAGLPHVGTVAAASDTEHAGRLVRRFQEELGRRRDRPAGGAAWPDAGAGAELILLVDGWESVTDRWAQTDLGRGVDDLLRLLREGAGVGVHLVISGGRGLLTGPVASLIGDRIVLALAEPGDAVLAGVPPGLLPATMPPGRCVRVGGGDPVEAQVATCRATPGQVDIGRPSDALPRPWRLPPLPISVRAEHLATAEGPGTASDLWLPVGVGGDDVAPVGLSLDVVSGVLVAGSPGSGRSTALATLAAGATRHHRDVLVVTRPGRSTEFRRDVLDPLDPHTAEVVGRFPGAVVLVDDAERWQGTAVEAALVTHLRAAAGTGGRVIAACATPDALAAFTGLLAEIRASRTGLLLGALAPGESEALGLRLPPRAAGPPGRGLLVVRGQARAVQVALPPERPATGCPGPERHGGGR